MYHLKYSSVHFVPGEGWFWEAFYVCQGPFDTAHDAVVDAARFIRERNQADARSKNFPTVAEAGVW